MKTGTTLLLLSVLLMACSPHKKLARHYIGKTLQEINRELGPSKTVFKKQDYDLYIFEKQKHLKATKIDQGKITLDKMVTPPVTKTERYYVTVKNDTIQAIRYEKVYNRENMNNRNNSQRPQGPPPRR